MLHIRLFDKPRVTKDDEVLAISLKKSEAVLYYIVYQGRATRDELIDLIWQEVDVATAKKNLRNCLYRLKRDLGIDVFSTPGKNIIMLKTSLVATDRDDANAFLETYQGSFLDSFILSDSPGFEQWVRQTNQSLQQRYMQLGRQLVEQLLASNSVLPTDKAERARHIAKTMYDIDPFDENNVRLMMRVYQAMGHYYAAIEVYEAAKLLLADELGIAPERETTACFYQVINSRNVAESEKRLYGRQRELDVMLQATGHVIVVGEAGVGKTALVNEACHHLEADYEMLMTTCYQMETAFNLKPWDELLYLLYQRYAESLVLSQPVMQVLSRTFPSFLTYVDTTQMEHFSSLSFAFVEKIICDMLEQIASQVRLLLYFEDLQWMDDASMRLMTTIALKCSGIRMIGTMRNEYSNAFDQMRKTLSAYKKLTILPLERFSRDQTYDFIDYRSPEKVSDAVKNRIFEESEGNAFFIVEMLRLAPEQLNDAHLGDMLGARFLGLPPEAEKVMYLITPFFDYASYEMLKRLYAGDEDQLIEAIQALKNRFIIKEILKDGDLQYAFTHHKLRTYLYDSMHEVKRRRLHLRIAEAWAEQLHGDVAILQRLVYHYQAADDIIGHLTYYLAYLETYFDFSHELYPEMTGYKMEPIDDRPELSFNMLKRLIDRANAKGLDISALEPKYHLMYGRYLIRQGYYDVGLREIDQLIQSASATGDKVLVFKGYVQRMYHAIQVGDEPCMIDAIDQMSAMSPEGKSKAILIRFKGVHAMLLGENERARRYFEESIERFESLSSPERYRLNIAAAYNYISETYRNESRYEAALQSARKAIAMCAYGNILRGLSIFNANAGIAAFLMADNERAKAHFETALQSYEQIDTLWRRSDAEAYLGLIYSRSGDRAMAAVMLAEAEKHAHPIDNPDTANVIEQLKHTLAVNR
ncbi:MAG: hypothetical protein PWP51_785 [Clostridiales bacterium]|nr:hypothetical protein [Clostridiales bacterium]MDN5298232.1 hypothetical protein [Clostridiales bacterium]